MKDRYRLPNALLDEMEKMRKRIKELEAQLDIEWDEERVEFDEYDSGLLNDFGGGQIEWWWDYIRAEVGRANEKGKVQFEYLLSLLKKEREKNSIRLQLLPNLA